MRNFSARPTKNLSWPQRLGLACCGLMGLGLLWTARTLEPDPRGFGTHEQLGLTACFFQQLTGHVCPTCGATTAWAHALRGNIKEAAGANLGGLLLCVVTIIATPWTIWSAAAGRWVGPWPTNRVLLALAAGFVAIGLLDWLSRWFWVL